MLWIFGFFFNFLIGGFSGVMLASVPVDLQVHDTYFLVAHFHYVLIGGAVFPMFAGIYHWFPKITGRFLNERLGTLQFWLFFVGFNLTFFPQFLLGYLGSTRRSWQYNSDFQVLHVLSSAGASILGVGYLLPLVYMAWSIRYGPLAGANPWKATGLEWQTPSPPPTHNFDHTPIVTTEPYNYGEVEGLV